MDIVGGVVYPGGGQVAQRFDCNGASQITTMMRALRDDFSGASLDPALWTVSQLAPGGSVSLSGGELNIATGTNANDETIITGAFPLSVPFRVWFIGRLSQRIANQEFYLEVVNAAGDMAARWLLDGTTATSGKYDSVNGGIGSAPVVGSILTTVSDSILELQIFPDEVWFANRGADSISGKSSSYCRSRNIPDPGQDYYVRVRAKNLGSAPASSTTLTIGAVAVQDINELTAEITGGHGDTAIARAAGVYVTGSATLPGYNSPQGSTGGYTVLGKLISAATTNATSVKASAANVGLLTAYNSGASTRYLKIYNKVTAPTVGTDTPVHTIPIPAGATINFPVPAAGFRLWFGFALAITGGLADADTTAVGASEVVVNWEYV